MITADLVRLASDPVGFIADYIQIPSDTGPGYVPFAPWPDQVRLVEDLDLNKYVALLKARQLGCSACVLAYLLWLALVEHDSGIALVSKNREEACKLVAKLRAMYRRLPEWLRDRFPIAKDSTTGLAFANGSTFYTFASNKSAGDGMTLRAAVCDECDLVDDLGGILNGLMPAISRRGQLILLSKSNKDLQKSKFKEIFRAARRNQNDFKGIFLPWWSRPDRDQAFYDRELRNQSIDYVYENFPASIEEALSRRIEATRIPLKWLEACSPPLDEHGIRRWPKPIESSVLPGVPGLRLYEEPKPGSRYVIGVDLASGRGENPNLDDSAAPIMERAHCRQVGVLVGKVEPGLFAEHVATLARHFNGAGVLSELNGRWGGQFFEHMKTQCRDVRLLKGPDGNEGFNTTQQTKSELYQKLAESARCGGMTICDEQTFDQLASIEGATLEAPVGDHDDIAIGYCLALWAADQPVPTLDVAWLPLVDTTRDPLDLSLDDLIIESAFDGSATVKLLPDTLRLLGCKSGRSVSLGAMTQEDARRAAAAVFTLLGRAVPDGEEPADAGTLDKVRAMLTKNGLI